MLDAPCNRCKVPTGVPAKYGMVHSRYILYSPYLAGGKSMAATPQETGAVETLRGTIIALVRSDRTDLTARQLGVFLTCYLTEEEQTVRGLAKHLNVAKPAISRALDRLAEADLIKRKTDTTDRRSVLGGRE